MNIKNTNINIIIGDMMITIEEILKNYKLSDLPKDHEDNLNILLEKANLFRKAYNKSLIVSSGYRSKEDQIRIYKEKGITDISKIPMKSKHLFGQALDFSDPNGDLKTWVNNNLELMKDIGLWFESFSVTTTWVHIQIVQYGSYKPGGSLFFNP